MDPCLFVEGKFCHKKNQSTDLGNWFMNSMVCLSQMRDEFGHSRCL